jgi:hypothetical protein
VRGLRISCACDPNSSQTLSRRVAFCAINGVLGARWISKESLDGIGLEGVLLKPNRHGVSRLLSTLESRRSFREREDIRLECERCNKGPLRGNRRAARDQPRIVPGGELRRTHVLHARKSTLFGRLRGNEVKSAFASATDCGWRENRQSRLGRCLRRQKTASTRSGAKARGEHFLKTMGNCRDYRSSVRSGRQPLGGNVGLARWLRLRYQSCASINSARAA